MHDCVILTFRLHSIAISGPVLDHFMLFSIQRISVEQTFPLRRAQLLNGTSESCLFRGDDEASTLHVAVVQAESIVAVATVCREAPPGLESDNAWRLRGVAVEPHLRGDGLGRMLVKRCCNHAQRQGGRLVWCTARESARGFYESLGFAASTPPFKLPARDELLFYEMRYVLQDGLAPDEE